MSDNKTELVTKAHRKKKKHNEKLYTSDDSFYISEECGVGWGSRIPNRFRKLLMLKVGELSHWLWVILHIYLLNITSSDHGSNIQNPLGEIFFLMKFSID